MKSSYSYKDSCIMFLLVIIGIFCSSFLLTMIISIISTQTGEGVSQLSSNVWINYLNAFLSQVVLLLIFIIYNLFQKIKWNIASRANVKLDGKIVMWVIILAIVVFFASLNFTNLFNYTSSLIINKSSSGGSIPLDNFWQFLMAVLMYAVLPAICEELVYRGVIYNGLRKNFSAITAIIISTLIFTVVHFSIFKTFHQLILGLVLGFLVYKTGSIIYGIIFHFFNNFIIIFLSYVLPTTHFSFECWGTLEVCLSILLLLIGIALSVLFFVKLNKYTQKHKNYMNLEKTSKKLEETEEITNEHTVNSNKMYSICLGICFAVCSILYLYLSIGG